MSLTTVAFKQEELDFLQLRNESCKSHIKQHNASKWRPTFHLTAPSGWLNDPCGMGYNPSTRLYHIGFQWNPKENDWGNVSWGSATSYDMVSWKTSPEPSLAPSTDYDHCGVFTGCLQPTDIDGSSGALTCIYTSVKHLPIHYTLPYVRGCESLSLAVSHDEGLTWRRLHCNPILTGPPSHLQVTSWRDPFVGHWRRSQSDGQLYGFISGGIVGQTPTAFVYTVDSKDLRNWQFIGRLVDVGLNFRPSRWSGDFGVNWEVANVLDLDSEREEGISRTFMLVGTEGCLPQPNNDDHDARAKAITARTARQQLWMALKVKPSEQGDTSVKTTALATHSFSGIFDHGCYYAANSFYDPVISRHVVWGWITEEDLPDNIRHAQGWSGLVSLPRIVELQVLNNVIRARRSELSTITSMEIEPDATGTYTVRTLGIQPDDRLKKLRDKASSSIALQDLSLRSSGYPDSIITLQTSQWEVEAEFAVHKRCTNVGVRIEHSADLKTSTVLSWSPTTETFTVERPHPRYPGINHGVECAPHTLLTFSGMQEQEVEETLRIHAIADKSVLEVFVNERTVISTRIYVDSDRCFQLSFFAEGDDTFVSEPPAVLMKAQAWDGLSS